MSKKYKTKLNELPKWTQNYIAKLKAERDLAISLSKKIEEHNYNIIKEFEKYIIKDGGQ